MQDLRELKSQKCDFLFSTIRDLGFNAFDRAIIVDAALDEATGNTWRTNPAFYSNCLSAEPKIRTFLEGVHGTAYFTAPVVPIKLVETELAENLPAYWNPTLTRFLKDARASFFSKGEYRISKFPAQNLLTLSAKDLGSAEYFPMTESEAIDTIRIADILKKMEVVDAGCFFGWDVPAGDKPIAAMLVATQDKQGKILQHVLVFEFEVGPASAVSKVVGFSMLQLDSPPASSYKQLVNTIKFPANASCKKKPDLQSATKV